MNTPKTQIDKFREAARELETDDDEKRFDERLGKVAKANPEGWQNRRNRARENERAFL